MNEEQKIKINDPTNGGGRVFFSPNFLAFSSPLFLTLCILVSVVAGFSLMMGSINVIYVLITIATWITYASACKGVLNHTGLAMISGTTKAVKILLIVVGIILIVSAVITAAFGGSAVQDMIIDSEAKTVSDLIADIEQELAENNVSIYLSESMIKEISELDEVIRSEDVPLGLVLESVLFGIVVAMFFSGAILVVIAFTFFRMLHKFHKSVCLNSKDGITEIKCAKAASIWLLVLGILSAIGALSAPGSLVLIQSLVSSSVYIVGYVFISRYFSL